MTRLALALLTAITLAGCSDDLGARRTLADAGYADIEITGYQFFGCGQGDAFHTGFRARSPAGRRGFERGYAAGVAWAVECVRPTTVEIPGAALETMDRHPIGQWFADLIERSAGRPRLLTAAPPPSELPNMPAGAAISPPRRTMSPPREQPQADHGRSRYEI